MLRYEKALGKAIKDFVVAQTDQNPNEQVALYEELALMRHICLQHTAMYSAAIESKDAAAVGVTAEYMRNALEAVAEMSLKAQRVESAASSKITATSLQFMIESIVRIIYKNAPVEIGERIEQEIRSSISIDDMSGTKLTPDLDVRDMDSTVPALEGP